MTEAKNQVTDAELVRALAVGILSDDLAVGNKEAAAQALERAAKALEQQTKRHAEPEQMLLLIQGKQHLRRMVATGLLAGEGFSFNRNSNPIIVTRKSDLTNVMMAFAFDRLEDLAMLRGLRFSHVVLDCYNDVIQEHVMRYLRDVLFLR